MSTSLDDDANLRRLAPTEIRARRRPGAIVLVYLWQLALGLIIATPVHAWAESVWGAHPEGDAVLFRPGARELLTTIGDIGPALAIATRTSMLLVVASIVLGQLVLGALLASLALGRGPAGIAPRPAQMLRAGAAAWVSMMILLVVAAIGQGIIVSVGFFVSGLLNRALVSRLGETPAFVVGAVALAIFALIACIVGVVFDVARAAAVRESSLAGSGVSNLLITRRAMSAAFRVARRSLVPAIIAWGWRAVLAIAVLGPGYAASSVLGGKGGIALVALFTVHQLVVLARTALRASWLARATRLPLSI
ncbi:MAG: hypothetical protein FWD69_08340 [Polyangiaceae bacterium]|nr:hypothetical protein [Polyangiaceae bacterium]